MLIPEPFARFGWEARPMLWMRGFGAVCAGLVLLFPVVRGLRLPFYLAGDADAIYTGQGLMVNGGLGQSCFDHPGYPYILMTAGWIRVAGWLKAVTHAELQPILDSALFGKHWTEVVTATRPMSFVLAAVLLWVFWALLRRVVREPLSAALATLLLAASGGFAFQTMVLRPDVLCSGLILGALLAVIASWQEPARARWLIVAGAAGYLAMLTKVQSIFLLAPLPLLAFALASGSRPAAAARSLEEPEPRREMGRRSLGLRPWMMSVGLFLAALPFLQDLSYLATNYSRGYQLLAVASWLSQAAVLAWLARTGWRRALRDSALCVAGVGIAHWVNFLGYDLRNLKAVLLFKDHMSSFTVVGWYAQPTSELAATVAKFLLQGFIEKLSPAHWAHFPLDTLYPIGAVAAGLALRRGERPLAIRLALLLGLAWGVEAVLRIRSVHYGPPAYVVGYYRVFIEPFVALVGALVIDRLWTDGRLTRDGRVAVLVAVSLIATAEVYRNFQDLRDDKFYGMSLRQTPEWFCEPISRWTPPAYELLHPRDVLPGAALVDCVRRVTAGL